MNRRIYILSFLLGTFCFLLACNPIKKKTDWTLRYSTSATTPYGFSVFNQLMPKLFVNAKTSNLPISNTIFKNANTNEKSAFILLAHNMNFNENDLWYLEQWMLDGNDVMIISENVNETLSDYLYLDKPGYWNFVNNNNVDFSTLNYDAGVDVKLNTYTQYGKAQNTYTFNMYKRNLFSGGFVLDTTKAFADTFKNAFHVISRMNDNIINAATFEIGDGRLILVSTPMAFTNYALLQSNNRAYLADIMSYVQADVKKVYYSVGTIRESSESNMSAIWKNKGTRLAIILALIGILIYVLVNLRRKQAIIPVIKPLTNDSKSFVETIASLYYNKRNNKNLAQKMIQHFLESVRTNYKLNTNNLDKEFSEKLSRRAGVSIEETAALVYQINSIMSDTVIVDDKYLLKLYTNIQNFNKK